MITRGVLKCVQNTCGEQCVVSSGETMMLKWFADSSVTQTLTNVSQLSSISML